MNEQHPLKNTLEDMKKDIKSLLGIKRNKEPTIVEKNLSSDIKKEITFKEDEDSKKIEINRIERQITLNKKSDNYVDLTLDENHQPDLNNIEKNNLNINEENHKIINKSNNDINDIENNNKPDLKETNQNKVSEQEKKEPELDLKDKPNSTEPDNELKIKKDFSPTLITQDNQKKELNDKREDVYSENINEISHPILDEKSKDNGVIVHNIDKEKEKIQTDNLIYEQKKESPNKTEEINNKEQIKEVNPSNALGFNLFTIKDLSLPKENILNLFKAPEKNIFENINMQNINFFNNKSVEKETLVNSKEEKIDIEKNDVQMKDNLAEKVSMNEGVNLIKSTDNKQDIKKEVQKIIVNETSKVEKKGFSLNMVPGFNNQKDQVMKAFTIQEDNKNPFGIGFESLDNKIFFKTNKTDDQQNINGGKLVENKPSLVISQNTKIIEQSIEEVSNINKTPIPIPDKKEEIKRDEIENKQNQINKNPEITPAKTNGLNPSFSIIPNVENLDKNNEAQNKTNIIPMDIEKNSVINDLKQPDNVNDNTEKIEVVKQNEINEKQKPAIPIEKKIILTSKIDQILNKKLEQTNDNTKIKSASEFNVIQKQVENKSININQIENKVLTTIDDELKKEVNKTVATNKTDSEDISKSAINLNTNTNDTNNKPTINLSENKNQPTTLTEKKMTIEEKTSVQPMILSNEGKTETSKNEDKITIKKDINETKEVKSELIVKSNQPEKQPIKPNEIENKDSSMSVSSVLKDTHIANNLPNKPENIMSQEQQNINKQVPPPAEPGKKRAITFQEAKEQIDKFSDLINNLEIEMRDKYGINIPQFYYEDLLPEQVKIKLVEEYFNDKEIVELGKQLNQKLEEKK